MIGNDVLSHLILLIWIHFIADFILQPRSIADNKSSNNTILAFHCLIYGMLLITYGFKFAIVNSLLHFITDYISSRFTKYYFSRKEYYKGFLVVGVDQSIHFTCLITTYFLIKG